MTLTNKFISFMENKYIPLIISKKEEYDKDQSILRYWGLVSPVGLILMRLYLFIKYER